MLILDANYRDFKDKEIKWSPQIIADSYYEQKEHFRTFIKTYCDSIESLFVEAVIALHKQIQCRYNWKYGHVLTTLRYK